MVAEAVAYEFENTANTVDFEEVVEPQTEQETPDFMKEQGGAYENYITGRSD